MSNPIITSVARGINLSAAGIHPEANKQEETVLMVSESLVKGVQTLMHTEDDIEKGHTFAETFEYIEKYALPVRRSGKDVKAGIAKSLKYMESQKAKCLKTIEKLQKKCEIKPSNNPSKYMTRGMEHKMSVVPKMYSYKDLPKSTGSESKAEADKINNKREVMQHYNSEVNNYFSICIDCIVAETMSGALLDDREYTFSVKQAAKL